MVHQVLALKQQQAVLNLLVVKDKRVVSHQIQVFSHLQIEMVVNYSVDLLRPHLQMQVVAIYQRCQVVLVQHLFLQ